MEGQGALSVEAQSGGRGGRRGTIHTHDRGFPGGPGVKNLLPSAWDMGLIPGWETKIPHASGQ